MPTTEITFGAADARELIQLTHAINGLAHILSHCGSTDIDSASLESLLSPILERLNHLTEKLTKAVDQAEGAR